MRTYIRLHGISRSTTAPAAHAAHDWPRYERQAYFTRPVKSAPAVVAEPQKETRTQVVVRCCLTPFRRLSRVLLPVAAAASLTGTAFSQAEAEGMALGTPMLSQDQLQQLVNRMLLRQGAPVPPKVQPQAQAQPKAKAKAKTRPREDMTTPPAGNPPTVDPAALFAAIAEEMGRKPGSSSSKAPSSGYASPSAPASGASSGGAGSAVVDQIPDSPATMATGSTGVGANASSGAPAVTDTNTNTNNNTNANANANANTNSNSNTNTATPPASAPPVTKPVVNREMPDIQFTAVDGRPVDLASLRGKVVLIDFWATWCGPCVGEIPNVVNAYNKYHDQGFEIIGISFDTNKVTLKRMMEDKGMPWPQYFDGKGWQNDFGVKFGIHGIPTMWLIDAKGQIITKNARTDLAGQVAKALAERDAE